MLKRRFKRRLASISYYGRPVTKRKRCLILLITVLLFISILVAIMSAKMRPVLVQMATAAATDEVTIIVNKAVAEKMADGSMDYEDLVTLEKDAKGNVTALVTNVAKINTLQAEITSCIIYKLNETDTTLVKIPIGNLIGGAMFSGRGPDIPVKIVSLTGVTTTFSNDFSSAGINQTRHVIMLNVDLILEVLIPGGVETIPMGTEVSVAETVIVGEVPNTYADFNSSLGENP